MTIKEAKIADKCLKNIYEAPVTNPYLLRPEIYKALDFIKFENFEVSDHIKKEEYLALLVSDGYLYKKDDHDVNYRRYTLTDEGKTFLLFKGGYTQMVEEKIENKKREKNKYRFDIGKDLVLILLAIGTLLISYFAS